MTDMPSLTGERGEWLVRWTASPGWFSAKIALPRGGSMVLMRTGSHVLARAAFVTVILALAVPDALPAVYAQDKLVTYQLVMLRQGPNAGTAEGKASFKAHIDHLYK